MQVMQKKKTRETNFILYYGINFVQCCAELGSAIAEVSWASPSTRTIALNEKKNPDFT